MQNVPESVLDKIRKLLAKADANSNDSQHEIEVALKMAQKLAMQYELDLAKLAGGKEKQITINEQKFPIDDFMPKNEGKWLISLFSMLARHNLCKCWQNNVNGKALSLTIIGEDNNIAITQFMFDQLVPRIRQLAKQSYREYYGHETKNTYIRGFLVGCVQGIDMQLREQRAEQQADSQIRGLILIKDAAIQKWMEDRGIHLGKAKNTSLSGRGGMEAGREAGRSVNIHKGISGTNAAGQKLL